MKQITAPLQQGQADGMCGLYSILNFLTRIDGGDGGKWDASADSMRYLLDACQHFGWLTPHYLTQGFEDFQLKAIIDLQIARYRISFETFYLGDVSRQLHNASFEEISTAIANRNGFVIANALNETHWLLVTKVDGSLVTIDSASARKPIRNLTSDINFSLSLGVVMLPRPHQLSAIDI